MFFNAIKMRKPFEWLSEREDNVHQFPYTITTNDTYNEFKQKPKRKRISLGQQLRRI